jgi:diadenosine tetraphosphate (Ap4A) HIT family hydrolase
MGLNSNDRSERGKKMNDCVFCTIETEILVEDEIARAFFDKYPVSEGHVLIVPKRHVASLFDATQEEMVSLGELLKKVKEILDERFHPDGYNIGSNVGGASGQTIFHWHVHVIPRYRGDAGSVRWHT